MNRFRPYRRVEETGHDVISINYTYFKHELPRISRGLALSASS
jgi:hypothetical protein